MTSLLNVVIYNSNTKYLLNINSLVVLRLFDLNNYELKTSSDWIFGIFGTIRYRYL